MTEKYLEEKERIFREAEERAQKIIEKYKIEGGFLDGEPWVKEMKKDSTRVLRELKLLQEKYENGINSIRCMEVYNDRSNRDSREINTNDGDM